MGAKTKIEWTRGADGHEGSSWNPIRARDKATGKIGWFCTHVSEGCRNCYAENLNRRLGNGIPYAAQQTKNVFIYLDEKMLTQPLRWGRPRSIFVGSMTDLFGEFVTDEMIDRVFAVMAMASRHTFIILTKRADRMRRYLADSLPYNSGYHRDATQRSQAIAEMIVDSGCGWTTKPKADLVLKWGDPTTCADLEQWPLPNVVVGVSVEDQSTADERIPLLIQTPAAVRFLSCEPLLGPVVLRHEWLLNLDWVIVGGESGPHARPMHPDWARALRDQCVTAGVFYFFKQWGEWLGGEVYSVGAKGGFARHQDGSDGLHAGVRDHWWAGDAFSGQISTHVGKHAAGRLLDGREWNESPINRSG